MYRTRWSTFPQGEFKREAKKEIWTKVRIRNGIANLYE
jgi:hypothetical protein